MSVTVAVLTKKFAILKTLLAGPVVAGIVAVSLALNYAVNDIKKRIDAEKKLKETIENGTIAQTDQLIALKEEELQRENLRSAHGRDRISRDKNIAKLEQEIEALEKRKKSMSELNDIMEKNKTYKVGEFTYDTASGKAISGPDIKQEERKFKTGSENEKAANSIKLLKQRIQIKSQENDIDRQLLERQFEFQNKMEAAMQIDDEALRLEKSKLLLKDYQIDRQEILNGKVKEQVSLSEELGETLEQGLVENIKGAINGTQTFGEAMSNVLNNIKNKLLDRALSGLFDGIGDAVFGGKSGGGFLSKIFGGGKAQGGPVTGGKSYLVGEKGPEIFSPRGSGNIIPNNQVGGITNNINISVNASGSNVESEKESQQFGQALATAIQLEIVKQKRSGGLLA